MKAIKARFTDICPLCGKAISYCDEIGMFLGGWVHEPCKKVETARRTAAAGGPVETPAEEPTDLLPAYVGIRTMNRRGFRLRKRRKQA